MTGRDTLISRRPGHLLLLPDSSSGLRGGCGRGAGASGHLLMPGDAVLRDDNIAISSLLLLRRSPGKVVTADLDVVVGELSVLVVIHAEKLSLGGSTEVKAGNEVDGLGDESRDDKGIAAAGKDVDNLLVELSPVAVEEATLNAQVDAIQADDVVGGEEGVENKTDDTTDGVFGEHIESIINAEVELDLGAKVAGNASNDTKQNTGPGSDDTGSGSGGDEARDGAGAPADERPLLGKAEIEKAPSHGGEHGSQAGVPAGHGSAEVGAESRAAVETEPSEPEKDSAESNERDVVGTEVEHHLLVAAPEHPRVGQSGNTRTNLDGTATSVVENTPLESPAFGAPGPVRKRAVDESSPEESKNHAGNDATTLSSSTDHEGSSNSSELHLPTVSIKPCAQVEISQVLAW